MSHADSAENAIQRLRAWIPSLLVIAAGFGLLQTFFSFSGPLLAIDSSPVGHEVWANAVHAGVHAVLLLWVVSPFLMWFGGLFATMPEQRHS